MQKRIRILGIGLCVLMTFSGQPMTHDNFKKNNPDGYKYEFARSYVCALRYFYKISQRWSQDPPKKKFKGDDIKTIRVTIEYFVRDNADLRIAKNYMVKYLTHPNALMRKVADM